MASLGHTTQSTGYGQAAAPFLLQLWRTDSTSILMVAFEDSSIASVAPMYVNEVTLPQLRILGLPFLFCGRATARDGQGGALAEWLEGCCEPIPEDDRICGARWRTFHAGHPSMTGGGKPLTRGQRLGSRLPSFTHPRCMHAAMTNPCHIRPLVIYELRLRVSSEEAQER